MLGGVITHKEGPITAHACVTYWFNGSRENGTNVSDLIVGLVSIETPLDEIMWSGDHMNIGFSTLVSMSAMGKVGISPVDFDWAPYLRVYYRFF